MMIMMMMMMMLTDASIDTTTTVIVAVVVASIVGGLFVAVGTGFVIWRRLQANVAAADTFIRPSYHTHEVACQPQPWPSVGRPTVQRTDLLTKSKRPRIWNWTPCETSPPTSTSWNARYWYSQDAETGLVPPALSKTWEWHPCSSSASGLQNWYRPAYHGGSTTSTSGAHHHHHQQYYYSRTVVDPQLHRSVTSLFSP